MHYAQYALAAASTASGHSPKNGALIAGLALLAVAAISAVRGWIRRNNA